MKFYLSSYRIGRETENLKKMILQTGKPLGYIPNALDFTTADPLGRIAVRERDMRDLADLGLAVELLDLRQYFAKPSELRRKIASLGGVWVSGGNTFVLRQAMKLSGLDDILRECVGRDDFVYSGYSAAGCVLSPRLDTYAIVDDPTDTPYEDQKTVLWDGLGLIDFAFMPHYDSDHSESADVGREIDLCRKNGIPFKAVRDGDVLIIQ